MGSPRAYRDRKYEFGKLLYAYRTRMALTQAELAEQIGVHWRTVQNWETGEYYPRAEVLQQLIAIFLRNNLFTPGNERAEALAFWQQVAADRPHALASFDESWFAATLAATLTAAFTDTHTGTLEPASAPVAPRRPARPAIIDWGEAIAVPELHGRDAELATLRQWIIGDRCHAVTLLGLGGMGKSSLAITFAQSIAQSIAQPLALATGDAPAGSNFDLVLFRSLQNAPPLAQVLDQTIQAISDQQTVPPESITDKISLLVQLFRQRRCLLILDNFETLLQPETLTGTYRPGYDDYGELLRALSEREHQSCLLLTSREKPAELGPLEGRNSPVRLLRLGGLDDAACQTILQAKEVVGTAAEYEALARLYDGNPLALNLVSEPIRSLFGGDIAAFLDTGDAFFGGVTNLMERQCARSTPREKGVIFWLAIEREIVPLTKLLENVGENMTQRDLLSALESLRRRGQIERSANHPAFTLQPLILEFVSGQVVKSVFQEIVKGVVDSTVSTNVEGASDRQFFFLQSHALVQAHAKDYVRHSQERLILAPLLNQLSVHYGGAGQLTRRLLALLDAWRAIPLTKQGYGPANVVHLLRLLRGDLRGLNLSRLALRDVYWQGVDAQESDLTQAWVRDNIFTEAFGIVHTVASSASGNYWAASSINGAVQVWRNEGRITHLSIPAHTKQVKALAFSPNERILATGSWDCTVKLWDTSNGALLTTLEGHSDYVQDLAFSPDGTMLASGSDDHTLRIWDVASGALGQTIAAHSDNTYGTVWSPDGKWVATCGFDHLVRVWDVSSGACVQTCVGHTRPVSKVAFSPDGTMLASGGFDRTLRVWEIASGACIKQFAEHGSTIMALAWNPDGRTLATCSYDGTIRLWELDRDSALRVLLGHTASINSIAFTAGGKLLLSSSDDQTVRVWDVASGWCVRVIAGYGLFFYGVVWSPDGRSLLSANSDTTLTIWNVADGRPRLTLRGHTHTVYGVAWSPDGLLLASSGFDQTVRIWDAKTGQCVRVIQAHTDTIYRVVWWSPNGRWLASAGRDQAVRVWDMNTGTSRWVGRGHVGPINEVVWSPDGQRLASCGEDRTVRLWRAEDGTLLQTLTGHKSSVAGLAWSPDGRRLASCGGGGTAGELFLWDAESGALLNSLVGHDSVVSRIAWSQDSKQLFSGGITGTIGWWDAESGANLQTRQGHASWIRSLNVSPDGSTLVSSGEDGVIHLWDIDRAELIRTLRLDRPYERMVISAASGMTEAQRAALIALGAVEQSI